MPQSKQTITTILRDLVIDHHVALTSAQGKLLRRLLRLLVPLHEVQHKKPLYVVGKYQAAQEKGAPRPPRMFRCADNLEGKKAAWVHEDVMIVEILLGRTYYSTKPGKSKAERVQGAEVRSVPKSEQNEDKKDNLDALTMPDGVQEPQSVPERPKPVLDYLFELEE